MPKLICWFSKYSRWREFSDSVEQFCLDMESLGCPPDVAAYLRENAVKLNGLTREQQLILRKLDDYIVRFELPYRKLLEARNAEEKSLARLDAEITKRAAVPEPYTGLVAKVYEDCETPADLLKSVAMDGEQPLAIRLDMARAAAAYFSPRLGSKEVKLDFADDGKKEAGMRSVYEALGLATAVNKETERLEQEARVQAGIAPAPKRRRRKSKALDSLGIDKEQILSGI